MVNRRKRKPIQITCMDCTTVFTAHSVKALRCPECRKLAKQRASQECMQRNRKIHKISKVFPPRKTIRTILADMEQYNKENKTCLSYGQYVSMIEKGEY